MTRKTFVKISIFLSVSVFMLNSSFSFAQQCSGTESPPFIFPCCCLSFDASHKPQYSTFWIQEGQACEQTCGENCTQGDCEDAAVKRKLDMSQKN